MICKMTPVVIWACGVLTALSTKSQTVILKDVDSGLPSPQGNYRWVDVADQVYSAAYRTNYNNTQASVSASFDASSQPVHGTLWATNLKPNFAYQLKLAGTAGTASNEKVGRAGRERAGERN